MEGTTQWTFRWNAEDEKSKGWVFVLHGVLLGRRSVEHSNVFEGKEYGCFLEITLEHRSSDARATME